MILFKIMSYIPVIGIFGKQLYASCLFGIACNQYFNKKYEAAITAYGKAIAYSQSLKDTPPFDYSFEQAYQALGQMYEKGLGTEKDLLKAEEYYLLAGTRGNTAFEQQVAMRSWQEQHWK